MSVSDKYTLKPSLSETFKGIIWKVETDDENSIVAIESRDISQRVSHFSAFDYATGKCLFKEIIVEDGWFWSLDRVHSGMIFLHSYVNQSNPEHKSIIAINCAGKIAWQQFHKTLYDVCEAGLIIYNPKIQPKTFDLISPVDGETVSAKAEGYTPVVRNILLPEIMSNLLPIRHLLPENIAGPVFFTEYNTKHILVFHTKYANLYNQQLIVYQHEAIILEDYLAQDIQKLNPEAFFIERNHLFYIRSNKQEFVSYLV